MKPDCRLPATLLATLLSACALPLDAPLDAPLNAPIDAATHAPTEKPTNAPTEAPTTPAANPADPPARRLDRALAGKRVCLDLNSNGRCDATEPHTLADAEGGFTLPGSAPLVAEAPHVPQPWEAIDTVVVIYTGSRAFDSVFGLYPGANGTPGRNPASQGQPEPQKDVDGSVLPVLPPIWGGYGPSGQPATLTQAQSVGLPNAVFQLDHPQGVGKSGVSVPTSVTSRGLARRYYQHLMQINGGANDRFAAYSDGGALSLGYHDGSSLALWKLAQRYTLADNFFMGAFGGSFLNHHYLVCACAPTYPNADGSPAKGLISAIDVDEQGRFVRLTPAPNTPASALAGPPRFLRDGALAPKDANGQFHAVNTMQPPYQPSGAPPVAGIDVRLADPSRPSTLPPQTQATIGDRLNARGVSWAWYAGAWNTVSAGTPESRAQIYRGKAHFQPHQQPFNYYAAFDPLTKAEARTQHLRDFDSQFLADAAAGTLPSVSFYKPQASLSQQPGIANLSDGDTHIAEVVARLEQSPQWPRMLIVITHDDNGGFYDHAPVPRGDRFGPGSRVPAILVSPLAKKGFVDKTPYDTGSILRFISKRWSLEPLPGLLERDEALQRNGFATMGDLTRALEFAAPASSVKQ